jgi:hypothetical protein
MTAAPEAPSKGTRVFGLLVALVSSGLVITGSLSLAHTGFYPPSKQLGDLGYTAAPERFDTADRIFNLIGQAPIRMSSPTAGHAAVPQAMDVYVRYGTSPPQPQRIPPDPIESGQDPLMWLLILVSLSYLALGWALLLSARVPAALWVEVFSLSQAPALVPAYTFLQRPWPMVVAFLIGVTLSPLAFFALWRMADSLASQAHDTRTSRLVRAFRRLVWSALAVAIIGSIAVNLTTILADSNSALATSLRSFLMSGAYLAELVVDASPFVFLYAGRIRFPAERKKFNLLMLLVVVAFAGKLGFFLEFLGHHDVNAPAWAFLSLLVAPLLVALSLRYFDIERLIRSFLVGLVPVIGVALATPLEILVSRLADEVRLPPDYQLLPGVKFNTLMPILLTFACIAVVHFGLRRFEPLALRLARRVARRFDGTLASSMASPIHASTPAGVAP